MRLFLQASVLVGLMLSQASYADEWFRLKTDALVLSASPDDGAGVPDLGENSPIEFYVNGELNVGSATARDLDDLEIPVLVTGLAADQTVAITGLPGASWTGSSILWSPAIAGTYYPSIEVRNGGDILIASSQFELIVHPNLSASVSQSAYVVDVGTPLVIEASASNLIDKDAVIWGVNPSPLPAWLALDDETGIITVNTSAQNSLNGVVLTAVDQTDLATASTSPFSISVIEAVSPWENGSGGNVISSVNDLIFAGGKFVAVGSSTTTNTFQAMTSADGTHWERATTPSGMSMRSVAYGNGRYVAVANQGTTSNSAFYSTDGIQWVATPTPQTHLSKVIFADGKFVALGSYGILVSPDGVNWVVGRSEFGLNLSGIEYGNGRFIATSGSSGAHVYSFTLNSATNTVENWTALPSGMPSISAMGFGDGKFILLGANGLAIGDGTSFAAHNPIATSTSTSWRDIHYADGKFVAVASSGDVRTAVSTDGINWTLKPAVNAAYWNSIAYANGRWVAGSSSGGPRIMTTMNP